MQDAADHIDNSLSKGAALKQAGNALFKQKDYRKALASYTKVFLWVNWMDQGGIENMLPGVEKKEKLTPEQALQCKTLRVSANLNCASCYLRLENYPKAIQFADRALKIDPSHSKARYKRGQARLRIGNLDGAEEDLVLAQHAFPNDAGVKREVAALRGKQSKHRDKERKKFAGMFDKL